MMIVSLVLTAFFYSAPAESVAVLKVTAMSGNVEISITDVESIRVSSEEEFGHELEGNVLSISSPSEDVTVITPPVTEIHVKAVSGDIELEYDTSLTDYPDKIKLSAVSGDVRINNAPPSNLTVETVSGDINFYGYAIHDPDVWSSVTDTVTTTSGDIYMTVCIPATFYISTYAGTFGVDEADSLCEELGKYTFESATGEVDIADDVLEKFAEFSTEANLLPGLEEETSGKAVSSFLKLWKTNSPIAYNRVQGVVLGVPISLKKQHTYGRFHVKDELTAGVRYAFSLKRWDFWIGVKKALASPVYLGVEAHSKVMSPDVWKMSETENSIFAFFLNQDMLDYYLSKGMTGGAGVSLLPYGDLFIGYSIEKLTSLEKRTDWSLFYPHKPFRDNPAVPNEGEYHWLTGHISSSIGPLTLNVGIQKSLLTPNDIEVKRILAQLRSKISWPNDKLYLRLTAGYSSTEEFPFGFRLGGPGTLPGYELNSIVASRFELLQAEYRIGFSSIDGVIFADVAATGSSFDNRYVDGGVGISTGPFTMLVARSIEKESPFRFVIRFSERL